MSRPKSAGAQDIDIADILGQKYLRRIDISKEDIDPPLICAMYHVTLFVNIGTKNRAWTFPSLYVS